MLRYGGNELGELQEERVCVYHLNVIHEKLNSNFFINALGSFSSPNLNLLLLQGNLIQ